MRLFSLLAIPRLLWCLALRLPGGAILLNKGPINRGPDDLVGGDGHFIELTNVELTEARNKIWKPESPIGLL